LDDTSTDGWYGLGHCLLAVRSFGEAAAALQRALALQPDNVGARCNLAEALFQLGRVDEAVQYYRQAAASGNPEAIRVSRDSLASIAPGSALFDNAGVLALRREWAEHAGRDIRPLTPAARDSGRKLRIGYVSAFFGDRNWMKPVFGVINQHDRDRFEIHMLSDGGDPAESSGYVDHADDRIWQTNALSNEQLARHIVEAGLDVLVDLNGYSAEQRLPLFIHRPARTQIGWFNMFATTGIPAFDCLVGDAAVLPPEEEVFYSERIHRVLGSYLAFAVRYPVPDVTPPPCRSNGALTFGSLGSAYKLTDAVVASWSRILAAAPDTRLLLKNATLDDASNRAVLFGRFAQHGIAAERLLLEGRDEHYEFLRAYSKIDVALDTFPYNGGTTTTEALWQGVPVLTFNGDRWASRTSRSLLLAAGLADWVMDDLAGYIAAAIRLARAPGTPNILAALRTGMRERLLRSQASDCAALCRALEALYVAEAR
jgi:predicted O-linked N-acetylglucosamine transferase (SPINDLY family)